VIEMADVIHTAACAVDKGQQRRKNEDSVEVIDLGFIEDEIPLTLAILADGMGGHLEGEVASRLAVDTVIQQIVENWHEFGGKAKQNYVYWLSEAVKAANDAIYSRQTNMGTTLVTALIVGQKATIANVGDSRAYHVSRGGITQITTDHSVVKGLVSAGMITSEQAREHPLRNCITQAVGTDEIVEADLFMNHLALGDSLLLCSDGLTNELDDSAIDDIIQAAASPQTACENLIAEANAAGGRDNISVALVQMRPAKIAFSMFKPILERIGG
jgi:PPM family protein phosphatase